MGKDTLIYSYCATSAPDDSNYRLHAHDRVELIYFIKGEVSYVIEGQRYRVHPHDIFIVDSSVYHRVKIEKAVEYARFDIIIGRDDLPEGLLDALLAGRSFSSHRASAYIDSLFEKLNYYHAHLEYGAFTQILASCMTMVLYTLLIEGKIASRQAAYSDTILKALQYIDDHLADIQNLDELYSFVNLSKCQFHRHFLRELNITPMNYIKMKRLSHARKALAAGKQASTVCYECGFSSYPSFYRAYKEYYGYSPSTECTRSLRLPDTLS